MFMVMLLFAEHERIVLFLSTQGHFSRLMRWNEISSVNQEHSIADLKLVLSANRPTQKRWGGEAHVTNPQE